jgi:hypothetical protein
MLLGDLVPDWLFEGLWQIYAALGLIALVLVILWWRDRRRYWLYGLLVVAALISLYMLLDYAVETDREQIGIRLQKMSQAVHNRTLNEGFELVADDAAFQGMNKAEMRGKANEYVNSGRVTDVIVRDFRLESKSGSAPEVAKVEFMIKVQGNLGGGFNSIPIFCKAQFKKNPTKGWQLSAVELFDPVHNDEPFPKIP